MLLNAITWVSSVTSGEVFFAAQENGHGFSLSLAVHSMGDNEMARWRERNVGIVC
jgi:hypothetical protein